MGKTPLRGIARMIGEAGGDFLPGGETLVHWEQAGNIGAAR